MSVVGISVPSFRATVEGTGCKRNRNVSENNVTTRDLESVDLMLPRHTAPSKQYNRPLPLVWLLPMYYYVQEEDASRRGALTTGSTTKVSSHPRHCCKAHFGITPFADGQMLWGSDKKKLPSMVPTFVVTVAIGMATRRYQSDFELVDENFVRVKGTSILLVPDNCHTSLLWHSDSK